MIKLIFDYGGCWMNNKYDVVIVGAGPSGIFTAYEILNIILKRNF